MAKTLQTLRLTATRVRSSLAGRILFSFLLMALLSLIIALVGIYVTSQAGSELASLLEQDRNFTGTVLTMERAAERQNSSVRAFLNRVGKEAETELSASIRDYDQSDARLKEILAGLNLPPD